MVTHNPTFLGLQVSSDSGIKSAKTIHIMAPAASPRPKGRYSRKIFTNKKAGTAIIGWGRLEKILQPAALSGEVPFGIITKLMARPSGILCTAMAVVMNIPKVRVSAKETPTLTPSANECTVMMPKNSNILDRCPPAISVISNSDLFSSQLLASIT